MNNIRIIPEAVITELKEIPIHSVCDNLGINYKGDCPSGHDSQGHNCFHTFPHTNTWNCFHCKDSGEKLRIDTIGLVETTLKVNFPEACNYLIEQFRPELRDKFTGISAEELQKITEKRQKTEQVYKALNYAMDYYTKKLWENKEAIDYLKGRKITEDFIRDNPYVKFGYAPLRQEDLRQELFSKFGEEITLATGLFSKSDKGVIYPTMKIWIEELKKEIPVITYSYQMGGQARYIIGRRFTPEMEGKIGVRRFSKLKLKDDGIIKNEIFGIDSLSIKNPQFKNSVLISEGLFDAILAIQNNIPCISPVTVTFSDKQLPEMCKTVRKFETVYIVPDPDSPGEKGAVETAKQLIKEGKSVKVVTLPRIDGVEKFDLADYFKQYTAEDFFQLCSQGISLIDFLIQSIPENTEKISLTKLLKDKEIIQIIQAIDAISQDYYKELLSKKFKLKSSTIKNLFQEVPGMDIKPVVKSKPLPPPPEDKETPPALPVFLFYTDTWNSEKFVSQHGENVKFCKLWGKWLLWTGQKWEIDKTGKIQQYVKATVKSLYNEVSSIADDMKRQQFVKHVVSSESLQKRKAMLQLAESELPILPDDLDHDVWLLNLSNGTYNLKTGTIQEHKRENLITKKIDVSYNKDASCPIWLNFLNKIFNNNSETINFVKKAIGYSLTGSTQEQCIFILYGIGCNGKSTLINIVKEILGDYSQQTPSETLMVKKYTGNVPNDIASLKGVRFVSSVETDEGRGFAESLVKQLTGDDFISARFLRQEFFEFKPECKIWLASNHKPQIRGTDHAIWRRIRLIPFTVTIPEEEKDFNLLDKLRSEKEGILSWAIDGCLEWMKEGLKPPEEVLAATDRYKNEMDAIGDFLKECCLTGNDCYQVLVSDLYKIYCKWSNDNGEEEMSQRNFGRKLMERGFKKEKGTSGLFRMKYFFRKIAIIKDNQDSKKETSVMFHVPKCSSNFPINQTVMLHEGFIPKNNGTSWNMEHDSLPEETKLWDPEEDYKRRYNEALRNLTAGIDPVNSKDVMRETIGNLKVMGINATDEEIQRGFELCIT